MHLAHRPALLLLLAVVVGFLGEAAADPLVKWGVLRCSACKVVAEEMMEKKRGLVEKEKQPVQVSHRLGQGKWDPHGDGGVKKLNYAESELLSIETIEHLCEKLSGYKIRSTEHTRLFTKDTTVGKEAEAYNSGEKDLIKEPMKRLRQYCHDLLGEFDDEVHALVRQTSDVLNAEKRLCTELSNACKPSVLEKATKKEEKNKADWIARKKKKWEKTRSEGSAGKVQIADLHLSFGGVKLNLSALRFNASVDSEGGESSSPRGEGPDKAIDGDAGTKWLDATLKRGLVVSVEAPVTIDAFSFTTANDYPERDPVRWEFEGGTAVWTEEVVEEEEGEKEDKEKKTVAKVSYSWVSLHSRVSPPHPTPFERGFKLPDFPLSEPATFSHFRFKPIFGKPKKVKKQDGEQTAKNDKDDEL